VERSSGGCQRRQLNIGGNRRLNRTFHLLAIIRLRLDQDTKDYIAKKKAEGKTKRAALRCLKTYLARSLFRFMNATMQQHPERWLQA
jgi:transposase